MARSTRSRGTGGKDPNQLHIDWIGNARPPAPAVLPPEVSAQAEARTGIADESLPFDQHLPWDFKTTFPQPLPEAIEAGIVTDEDTEPENIRAMHEEYARELFAALGTLDAVLDARRRGVDPATGSPPATPAGKERLKKMFDTEPARLERWWQTLLDTYETAFGAEAADAFGKAIRARHAGIEVIGHSTPAAPLKSPATIEETPDRLFAERVSRQGERRRIVARLPVPRPLPSAVAAGHFGHEEDGRPEARHVDLVGSRWVFPASESKGKRVPRVVYLTPTALEISKRLMEKHPTGVLFRNTDGKPWTPYATNCRFQYVRRKTGVKYSLYSLRHSFAQHALIRGVDCITVATLLGHSDPNTLGRVYQHLSQNSTFLQEQLRKATDNPVRIAG